MVNNDAPSDNDREESAEPFEVLLTDEALFSYSEITSTKIYTRIGFLIVFLALHPYYGEAYDPYYKAAVPPIPSRVFYCSHYGIYYHVNIKTRTITVLAIVDQRRDPLARFSIIQDD